jgi:hypothetical protein
MMDLLFTLGQIICICGLLYGAFLSITYVPGEKTSSARINFGHVTTHRDTRSETLEQRMRRVSAEVWHTPQT